MLVMVSYFERFYFLIANKQTPYIQYFNTATFSIHCGSIYKKPQ